MLILKTIRWKNLLSTGNTFSEINLNKDKSTLIIGPNGSGKCLNPNTKIQVLINNSDIKKIFEDFIDEKNNTTTEI